MSEPTPPEVTCARLRAAVLAGDAGAVAAQFAPDAVMHLPTSEFATRRGREEIRALYAAVLGGVTGLEYTAETGAGDQRALIVRYRAGGRTVEEAVWLTFGEDGLIREARNFARPLAGLTALSAATVPRFAAQHGAWRRPVMALLAYPLALVTGLGDRLAVRLSGITPR